MLAAAGMKRLGIESWPGVEFAPLSFDQMVPAVGQGAIAVQCREGDAAKFAAVFDSGVMRAVTSASSSLHRASSGQARNRAR